MYLLAVFVLTADVWIVDAACILENISRLLWNLAWEVEDSE